MLLAPSLKEVREALKNKQTPLIGLIFAPPYTKVAHERIVPRLGYLNARTAEHIHFFCAGYGAYRFAEDAEPIGEVRCDDGRVTPWEFSQRRFAAFVNEMEATTLWRYSGEADLILLGSDLGFSDSIVFDIEAMLKDGAIDNPARLFEAIIEFARTRGVDASSYELSSKEGIRLLGEAALRAIIDLLPKPLQKLWNQGVHYRVQNLSRQS